MVDVSDTTVCVIPPLFSDSSVKSTKANIVYLVQCTFKITSPSLFNSPARFPLSSPALPFVSYTSLSPLLLPLCTLSQLSFPLPIHVTLTFLPFFL